MLRENYHAAFRRLQDVNVEKSFSWKIDIMVAANAQGAEDGMPLLGMR